MKIRVKPKEGLVVRDPKTKKALPKDGALVEETSFWIRRINDGDVSLIQDVPKMKAPVKETPKPKETKKTGEAK
jgi:hypothetical protein